MGRTKGSGNKGIFKRGFMKPKEEEAPEKSDKKSSDPYKPSPVGLDWTTKRDGGAPLGTSMK